MPELPEVETTLRGIQPYLTGATICDVIVRDARLREPVSRTLPDCLGLRIVGLKRRAKYIICEISDHSHWLIHLGMSGSLRIVKPTEPFKKHDHIAITMSNGLQLRFHDPRRFGMFCHIPTGDPDDHKLLRDLGPEPLSPDFTPDVLDRSFRTRNASVKAVIMDAKVVAGIGNIYASEALFHAGIRPQTPAAKISKPRIAKLTEAIRAVIENSILQGGTTLRDFLQSDGSPGYFRQSLFVYGRTGEPCRVCGATIKQATLGQRSTFWCPRCQR